MMSMITTHEQMGWGIMDENGWRKGPWTAEEDRLLIEYVKLHGEGRWNSVARLAGLRRNGKSCRLRWVNYLRPDLKRGQITPHEERIIVELHARWGNRWSTIARSLPGRTDNEIKNYWRTHFKKKTKISSTNNPSENSTARLLRRQQFKHMQQQQQNIQQQQLQQEINQVDMRNIMCLFDENNENKSSMSGVTSTTTAPQTWFSYPSFSADQEHGFFHSLMINGCSASMAEANSSDDIMCDDGLWNLDDFHGANNKTYSFIQPVAAPFY